MANTTVMEAVSVTSLKEFSRADIYQVDGKPILLVKAKNSFISFNEFREVFEAIGEIVKRDRPKKLIFDKRELRVFDQASMEWYFVEWKAEMHKHGLSVHRKILPEDTFFRNNVSLGRQIIEKKHPDGAYKQMDIGYAESLEEAVEK